MKRTKSSVRFDPYYKIQWYDQSIQAWRDIQKQFPSPVDATRHFPHGLRCRLMEITMQGRHPFPLDPP